MHTNKVERVAARLEQAIAVCQTGIERERWRELVSAADEAALLLRLLARDGASVPCSSG